MRNKGVTLVELLVSLAVFVAVLGSCLFALASAHHLSSQSRERLLALNTARSALETIKDTALRNVDTIPQAQLDALVPTTANGVALLRPVPPSASVLTLAWIGNVTGQNGNLDTDDIANITVRVRWLGQANRAQNFQMTTMKSRF